MTNVQFILDSYNNGALSKSETLSSLVLILQDVQEAMAAVVIDMVVDEDGPAGAPLVQSIN
jgi:hypothetical protein